jgi:hypothetical protein
MFTGTKLIAASAWILFLGALVYVGYVNELLKGALAPWHRAAIMIGFIVGAGAVSRYIANIAGNHALKRNRARR